MGRSYLSKDQTVFDSHRKREDTSKKQNKPADAFLVMYIHKIMLFNNFMAIITGWEKISFSKSLSSTSFFFILTFFILKQKQFFFVLLYCVTYWKCTEKVGSTHKKRERLLQSGGYTYQWYKTRSAYQAEGVPVLQNELHCSVAQDTVTYWKQSHGNTRLQQELVLLCHCWVCNSFTTTV